MSQKVKTFRMGLFSGSNAVNRKIERYARRHNFQIISVDHHPAFGSATAVFDKVR